MNSYLYLDESGDLGWTFDKPYRGGGSSRFLTLCFLLIPEAKRHLTKRIVQDFIRKYQWKNEKKGADLSSNQKLEFCQKVKDLFCKNEEIKLFAITVKKQNVQDHIKNDSNLLYNYMTKLCIIDELKYHSSVTFIPDQRSIKIESGKSLPDYIKTELWFSLGATTNIIFKPSPSHQDKNLMFIDWVTNLVWNKYEWNNDSCFNELKHYIVIKHLFF